MMNLNQHRTIEKASMIKCFIAADMEIIKQCVLNVQLMIVLMKDKYHLFDTRNPLPGLS